MAKPVFKGIKVVFGRPTKLKPIIGLPAGKVRLRFGRRKVGKAIVTTATHLEYFALLDNGETWGLLKQSRLKRWEPRRFDASFLKRRFAAAFRLGSATTAKESPST